MHHNISVSKNPYTLIHRSPNTHHKYYHESFSLIRNLPLTYPHPPYATLKQRCPIFAHVHTVAVPFIYDTTTFAAPLNTTHYTLPSVNYLFMKTDNTSHTEHALACNHIISQSYCYDVSAISTTIQEIRNLLLQNSWDN